MLKRFGLIGLAVVLIASYALAETVRLKDGTLLEGVVIKQGTKYWIKTKEGDSRTVDATEVAAVGADAAKGAVTAKPGDKSPPGGQGSADFQNTKNKADRADQAIIAVQIWEAYIDTKPGPADLDLSKAELARWQKYQKESYEKVNGKWIGADELKRNRRQVADLVREAQKNIAGTNMLQGVKSLEQALKLDPTNFEANFTLGYVYLLKGGTSYPPNLESIDKAIKVLETTTKLNPNDASTLSNLAIGYNFRQKYEQAVLTAYKAVQIEDNKGTVTNLVATLSYAPPNMRENNSKVRPIVDEAKLLAGKYAIDKPGGFVYMPPTEGTSSASGANQRKGLVWMGSGFFITPDGYFLTNRHVATGDPDGQIQSDLSFRCRYDDGTEKNCELIGIDEKWDIALMRVKSDKPVPYLKIVDRNPNPAAHALVLGYPATGDENPTMQVASGAVKSVNAGDMHEVWFDLSTTHGNSGGPIVDRNGYVIGILTGGRKVYDVTYVLGIGPMQLKKFFENLGDKAPKTVEYVPPGTGEFDGEKLAIEARKSTLLVLAIRGDAKSTKSSDKE